LLFGQKNSWQASFFEVPLNKPRGDIQFYYTNTASNSVATLLLLFYGSKVVTPSGKQQI
jgi:hypothetical protein